MKVVHLQLVTIITTGIGPMRAQACEFLLRWLLCDESRTTRPIITETAQQQQELCDHRRESFPFLCSGVQLVMSICPERVKEAFFIGTSGMPAAVGGILNPPRCNTTNTNRGKGQVVRTGDLCIPLFAINWDCKLVRGMGEKSHVLVRASTLTSFHRQ